MSQPPGRLVHDKLTLRYINMNDNIPIELTIKCGHCGELLRAPVDVQDSDSITCNACQEVIGPWGKVREAAQK